LRGAEIDLAVSAEGKTGHRRIQDAEDRLVVSELAELRIAGFGSFGKLVGLGVIGLFGRLAVVRGLRRLAVVGLVGRRGVGLAVLALRLRGCRIGRGRRCVVALAGFILRLRRGRGVGGGALRLVARFQQFDALFECFDLFQQCLVDGIAGRSWRRRAGINRIRHDAAGGQKRNRCRECRNMASAQTQIARKRARSLDPHRMPRSPTRFYLGRLSDKDGGMSK
jgi:hypothetical protein